jgi:hypothetical protein
MSCASLHSSSPTCNGSATATDGLPDS